MCIFAVDYTPGSDQWNWLAYDLLRTNRTVTPWVIVNIHNPWYGCTAVRPMLACRSCSPCQFSSHMIARGLVAKLGSRTLHNQANFAKSCFIFIGPLFAFDFLPSTSSIAVCGHNGICRSSLKAARQLSIARSPQQHPLTSN